MSAVVVRNERNGAKNNVSGAVGPRVRSGANKIKMRIGVFVTFLLACAMAPALAQTGPMSGEITAACMQAMDETETICACIEEDAIATLTDDQQTFLVAIMTEDESLIDELRGTFTNEDAQLVQNQMVNAAMQCLS